MRPNLLHQCLDGALAGSGQGIMSCFFFTAFPIFVCSFYCARSLNCNKQEGKINFFEVILAKDSSLKILNRPLLSPVAGKYLSNRPGTVLKKEWGFG